jgi:LPXTG-motif cell wall-anchored protein
MRTHKKLGMACAAALLALAIAAPVGAQGTTAGHITYFTFSQPVRLPGVTLPAGRYLFQLADLPGSRNIVQVFAGDRSKILTTLIAISTERMQPSDDPEIRFMEAPAGAPPPIRTWWYPGLTIGHEFVYPRSEALRLAKATGEEVLTTKTDVKTDEMKTAELARVSPGGEDTGWIEGSGMPKEEPVGMAQRGDVDAEAVGTSGTAAQDTTADTRQRLPQTASSQPLVALFGLASLGAALGLRLRRARQGS